MHREAHFSAKLLKRALRVNLRYDPSTKVLGYFQASANADAVLLLALCRGRRSLIP
jgi:hypothetical protein